MDTASTLIGLGLLALFVLPVLVLIWQQNAKEKNQLKSLKAISSQNNLTTDTQEVSAALFLGLDSELKKLLVVEPTNKMKHRVIDLSEIESTKLSTVPLTKNNNGIQRISLDLLGKPQHKKLMEIIFYDEDNKENKDASESLITAKKWNRLISERL